MLKSTYDEIRSELEYNFNSCINARYKDGVLIAYGELRCFYRTAYVIGLISQEEHRVLRLALENAKDKRRMII